MKKIKLKNQMDMRFQGKADKFIPRKKKYHAIRGKI